MQDGLCLERQPRKTPLQRKRTRHTREYLPETSKIIVSRPEKGVPTRRAMRSVRAKDSVLSQTSMFNLSVSHVQVLNSPWGILRRLRSPLVGNSSPHVQMGLSEITFAEQAALRQKGILSLGAVPHGLNAFFPSTQSIPSTKKGFRHSPKPFKCCNILKKGAGGIRTHDGGFAIRCLSHLATAPQL